MGKIAILGAGESGAGTAILAKKQGYDVFVSDMGTIQEKYKALLDANNIEWEEGKHTAERILDADEVVKSPGIPDTAPLVRQLIEQGTPILADSSSHSVTAMAGQSASRVPTERQPQRHSYII